MKTLVILMMGTCLFSTAISTSTIFETPWGEISLEYSYIENEWGEKGILRVCVQNDSSDVVNFSSEGFFILPDSPATPPLGILPSEKRCFYKSSKPFGEVAVRMNDEVFVWKTDLAERLEREREERKRSAVESLLKILVGLIVLFLVREVVRGEL